MPWLRLDDTDYDDPLVRAVGNSAYGALTRMKLYCSAQRTDGWIDATKARELATTTELRKLADTRIGDGPPLLHRPGDECRCLHDRPWPGDAWYYVHAFLDRNPSRSENDVHKAKRRELRDPALKAAVRHRDGDTCRYCGITVRWRDRRTPTGGTFDHVDPRLAAGADNLVVACRGCNARKKDCTPAEAGMDLLPPPEPAPASTTDLRRDLRQIYDRSETDAETDPDPVQNRRRSPPRPHHPPDTAPAPAPGPVSRPHTPENSGIHDDIYAEVADGMGRGRAGLGHATETLIGAAGYRPTVGPPTTPRDHLAPNPYLKTHTGNPHAPPRGVP